MRNRKIFFISQPKHYVVGTQKNPKHMLKIMGKRILTILAEKFCLSKPVWDIYITYKILLLYSWTNLFCFSCCGNWTERKKDSQKSSHSLTWAVVMASWFTYLPQKGWVSHILAHLHMIIWHRGGSRIPRKGVHMYKGVGGCFSDFISFFLNIPWKWNNLVSLRPNYLIFTGYL